MACFPISKSKRFPSLMGLKKTICSSGFIPSKLKLSSTLAFTAIILLLLLSDVFTSRNSKLFEQKSHGRDQDHFQADRSSVLVPTNDGEIPVELKRKLKQVEWELFETSALARKFDSRVKKFFTSNACKVKFFMTWIAPADSYKERQFFVLESLFETNPDSCVIILSKSMDSIEGDKILEPFVECGYRILAVTPDISYLFKDTPAETWLADIKNGKKNPGHIPLAQNMSNLMRLVALYKYGGVYLDTDLIVLKDFSGLRNVIGAQSLDGSGNWTRLNNAVLVFDRNHQLLYKFMEEFASTFNGNKWGFNGPYLVSRVVERVAKQRGIEFAVLSPRAFYPVDWIRISKFFTRPRGSAGSKWVDAKVRELNELSYGVHLWNRESKKLKIEKGSVIDRLLSDHCVICSRSI